MSIDTLRSLKKPIDPAIHSVPALFLPNTKEYMFGKSVFAYLLLPNRGVLFTNTIASDKKGGDVLEKVKEPVQSHNSEPLAFSLGTIYSENFSSLEDDGHLEDKNYTWDTISETSTTQNIPVDTSGGESQKKNLPTMEDIMKQRASDIS